MKEQRQVACTVLLHCGHSAPQRTTHYAGALCLRCFSYDYTITHVVVFLCFNCRACAELLAQLWSQKVLEGVGESCVKVDDGIARCTLDIIGASGFQVQFR
jgi:hypothetical protein